MPVEDRVELEWCSCQYRSGRVLSSANPKHIIGWVDPASMREIREGLFVRGKLDLENSEAARDVWQLVKNNTISLSFGYLVTDPSKRADGIQELRESDLFEVSLTPAPANPDT